MKNIAGLLILDLAVAGSFYYGQRVASDNAWTSCEALQASHSATVMTGLFPENISVESYKDAVEGLHYHAIVDGFIGLGRFESEMTSKFPMLVGDPDFAIEDAKVDIVKISSGK